MRGLDSGYAHGTSGSPQETIEQTEYAAKVAENEARFKEIAENLPLIDENLLNEIEQSGAKFKKENVILTTRDSTGQLIWLEAGNASAGYKHMQKRHHDAQLAKYLTTSIDDVPRVLRNIIAYGRVIGNELVMRHGRPGYERRYEYNGKKVILAAIGTNGFLVTAYPDED